MTLWTALCSLLSRPVASRRRRSRPEVRGARSRPPVLEPLEGRLAPATLTVNSTADRANPNDPYLTLREAIAIVNSPTLPSGLSSQILAQINGILHDGGADNIRFSPGVTAITLGGTQLELSLQAGTAAVTIDGGTAGVTVDGNNASRVLQVDAGVRAALVHLTLAHGKAAGQGSPSATGGGVYSLGDLTVDNCTLRSNTAEGSGGALYTGNGGGIFSSGTLTVTGSILDSNRAQFNGGGIFSTGTLTVTGSTFTHNLTGTIRGGVGTIFSSGSATVSGCTIASNTANGEAAIATVPSSSTTVTGCTIESNAGGALGNGGSMTAAGCTLRSNSSSYSAGCIGNAGTMILLDSTLESNTAAGNGGGIVNSGTLTVDNCRLSANSALGGTGGAVSNTGALTLTGCTVTGNRASLSRTGTGTETAYARGGGIYTTGPLTLTGCTVSGNTATLTAGNIAYGNANGGGIYADGAVVTLTDSTVSGNTSVATFTGGAGLVDAYGGGLTCDNGSLTLTGCTVAGNTVTSGNDVGQGGGVHGYQSTVTLTNCTIASNTAVCDPGMSFGGGVSDLGGAFTLTSCTISGNAAASAGGTGSGGGLYFDGSAGSFQADNTIVAGNTAATGGPDASGPFSSLGYNLVGITDGSAGWVGSDQTGTASSPLDPMLGTLGDHGGLTWTIPLLAGSPALNAGDPGLAGTADQRGVVRSGGVNIGAFQASAASLVLTAPGTATSGVPFDVSVAVYDSFGQLAVGYTGTVHFSTTDGDPGVVLPADYTFGPGDGGSVTFSGGVTLFTSGSQTVTATDLSSGISGSGSVTL
jgi:predicted outer membrane repeat protein